MRRMWTGVSRKIWLTIGLFAVGGILWLDSARLSESQRERAVTLADAAELLSPGFEYTVHDGTVLDGAGETSAQQAPDAPG